MIQALKTVGIALLLASSAAACSDDDEGGKPDAGARQDATTDLTVPLDSSTNGEAGGEDGASPLDAASTADGSSATRATVSGTVTRGPGVTCDAAPATDCKGQISLLICKRERCAGATSGDLSDIVEQITIASADLSGDGQVDYSIEDVPAGSFWLSLVLFETSPGLGPGAGDIVGSAALTVAAGASEVSGQDILAALRYTPGT